MSIITQGLGGQASLLITQGYGKRFKIEVVRVGAYPPYWYEVKKIDVEILLTGDLVIKQSKTIKVVGIRDLYLLIVALQDEEPNTIDDILELVCLYDQLKDQVRFEEVDQETLELLKETRELLDMLFEKLKKEADEDESETEM